MNLKRRFTVNESRRARRLAIAMLVVVALIGVVDWVAAQTTIWTGGYNSQIPINYGLPDRQDEPLGQRLPRVFAVHGDGPAPFPLSHPAHAERGEQRIHGSGSGPIATVLAQGRFSVDGRQLGSGFRLHSPQSH